MVSAGLVGAVGNRVRVGRPGCTGSIHSDFALSLCTVFAKLLLLNVCHKNNFGPGLTFYRLRLSRLPLVGLSWMQGVAPWRRKEIQGGLHLGIFAHLPTLSPTSSNLSLSWQEQNPSHHHHADPARLHGGLLHGHVGHKDPIHLPSVQQEWVLGVQEVKGEDKYRFHFSRKVTGGHHFMK